MPAAAASWPTLSLVVSTPRTLGPCRAGRSSSRPPSRSEWRRFAGDGDARRCGDRECALAVQVVDEARRLMLRTVIGGAVPGEVRRVGGAERVRDVVVELAPLRHPASAAGEAAAPVAGADEPVECGAGAVPVRRPRWA